MPMFPSAITIILHIVIVSVFNWDFYRSTLVSTTFKGIEPVDNCISASKYVDNQEFLVTHSLSS